MFHKKYQWVDDWIKETADEPAVQEAFEMLKKELLTKDLIIEKLRYELKKYKPSQKRKIINDN